MSIEEIVRVLGLAPHPEGGFYRETYRAPLVLPQAALAASHGGPRAASTAIHFLVPRGSFSALHRIASDEVWHFYAGAPLEIVEISPSGALRTTRLGNALAEGEVPQHVVPAGAPTERSLGALTLTSKAGKSAPPSPTARRPAPPPKASLPAGRSGA